MHLELATRGVKLIIRCLGPGPNLRINYVLHCPGLFSEQHYEHDLILTAQNMPPASRVVANSTRQHKRREIIIVISIIFSFKKK